MTLLLAICLLAAGDRTCGGAEFQFATYAECQAAAATIRATAPPSLRVLWHECRRKGDQS